MRLQIISGVLIALTYFCIAASVFYIIRIREDLESRHLRLGFIASLLFTLCGLLSIINIIDISVPILAIDSWINALTAALSLATAGCLAMLLPRVIELRSIKRMQLEMALHRKSAVLLSTVIELVPGLVCAKDGSGRMLFANQVLLDAIGKQWADVEGRQDIDFLSDPHQAALIMANDRRIMDAGTTLELEETVDHPVTGPRVYLSTKVPLSVIDERMNGLVCFAVDVTERAKNTQEQLHTARRTAMGDVATAIAHELNQPLTAVSLYLGGSITLLDREHYEGPVREALVLANEQCLRAGEIIRQVRNFVSGGDEVMRPESIRNLVDEACALALLGVRDGGIAVSIEHSNTDLTAVIQKVQIEQVIVNLVRNAIDAMGHAEGSTLRIKTDVHAKGMMVISVADNGPGIRADVAHRLFEPFVSTKGVNGMGVGLSICRTIIESHGGKIWASSDAGAGATFHFTLPLVDDEQIIRREPD